MQRHVLILNLLHARSPILSHIRVRGDRSPQELAVFGSTDFTCVKSGVFLHFLLHEVLHDSSVEFSTLGRGGFVEFFGVKQQSLGVVIDLLVGRVLSLTAIIVQRNLLFFLAVQSASVWVRLSRRTVCDRRQFVD